VIVFVQVILRLLADFVGLIALSVRPRRSVEAENLFLRRELALYRERGIKPRRVDAATRVSLALLSRLFDCGDALARIFRTGDDFGATTENLLLAATSTRWLA